MMSPSPETTPENVPNGEERKPKKKSSFSCQLELHCRGRLVQTITFDDPDRELTIGKAPDNDFRIPESDHSSEEHHAKLRLAQNGVKIIAAKKCKVYFHGEQVSEALLKKNERAAFGDSELFVKVSADATNHACDTHRLEILSGDRTGEMIRLEKSPFRIGSAPDSDLVLKSDVVSRRHAEIRITPSGETWLKDLNSSNGTFVNGEQLGSQERMLMDSDEISIACFDYRFLDRNVVHTRTQFGKKIQILVVTLLLAMAAFGGYYYMSPTTETVINVIDYYLNRNDYDAAERILAKMPDSKGFQRYEKQYQEFRRKIPVYRSTYNTVLQFHNNLNQSKWSAAAECFGKLGLDDSNAWNLADPSTSSTVQKLKQEKALLDELLSLRAVRSSLNTTIEDLIRKWTEMKLVKEKMEHDSGEEADYMKPLYQELQSEIDELEFDIKSIREVDLKMADLSIVGDQKQLAPFIDFLQERMPKVSGIVRIYFRDLATRLETVETNIRELDKNDRALFDIRLEDVQHVALISADDCIMIPQLYRLRQHLENRNREQLRCRNELTGLQKHLAPYALELGKFPEEIALFSNESLMEEVFAQDYLSDLGKITDDYEKLFGVRYFYEVLQQTVHTTSNIYASDLIPDMKVVPRCILLKDLYRSVTEALVWFNLPQNQWLIQGEMKKKRDYLAMILNTRDNVLRAFENIAARNRNNREYFLSKTAYFFFAPNTPDMPGKMLTFSQEWRNFRLKQQSYLENFDLMDEEKIATMKKTIIEDGIPGDPVFNWVRSME